MRPVWSVGGWVGGWVGVVWQVLLSRVRDLSAGVSRVLKDHLPHRHKAAAAAAAAAASASSSSSTLPAPAAPPMLSVSELVALETYLTAHAVRTTSQHVMVVIHSVSVSHEPSPSLPPWSC